MEYINKGKFALRVVVNSVIAAILFSLVTGILGGITKTGAVFSALVSLAVMLFGVPKLFEIHPGEEYETIVGFVFSIPVASLLVGLVNSLSEVKIPVLEIGGFGIGSVNLVWAIASYTVADLIYSYTVEKLFK